MLIFYDSTPYLVKWEEPVWSRFFCLGVIMSQDPKNETTVVVPEQLTAEAELLEETFGSADTLEDFTKALMESLTSKLHSNIDEIFKNK